MPIWIWIIHTVPLVCSGTTALEAISKSNSSSISVSSWLLLRPPKTPPRLVQNDDRNTWRRPPLRVSPSSEFSVATMQKPLALLSLEFCFYLSLEIIFCIFLQVVWKRTMERREVLGESGRYKMVEETPLANNGHILQLWIGAVGSLMIARFTLRKTGCIFY